MFVAFVDLLLPFIKREGVEFELDEIDLPQKSVEMRCDDVC